MNTAVHPPFPKKTGNTKEVTDAEVTVSVQMLGALITKITGSTHERAKELLDRTVSTAQVVDGLGDLLTQALLKFDDASKEWDKISHPLKSSVKEVLEPLMALHEMDRAGKLDAVNKRLAEIATTLERIQKLQQDPEMNRLLRQMMGGQL